MIRRAVLVLGLVPLALAACDKHQFRPPDRAARVAAAEAEYSPLIFDSIRWESDEARLRAGNEAFAVHCRSCHGPLGEGTTPYARSRHLDVPSLVRPDWAMAGNVEAVRHRVYTGHKAGMPTWGVGGITPREIDGVAYYVVNRLRPDALGER